jgi:hypothetical protein
MGGAFAATAALPTAAVPSPAPFSFVIVGFVLGPVFPTAIALLARMTPAAQEANACCYRRRRWQAVWRFRC